MSNVFVKNEKVKKIRFEEHFNLSRLTELKNGLIFLRV